MFARGSRPDCQKTALKTLKLACLDMHVLRFMRKVDSSENVFVVVFFSPQLIYKFTEGFQ